MSKITTISGWGQKANSLENALSLGSEIVDYLQYSPQDFFKKAEDLAQTDILIGWSLGGQIALEITSIVKPKLLVLIATPIKFESNDDFLQFQKAFAEHPAEMLKRFSLVIAQNDQYEKSVAKKLTPENSPHNQEWLEYLAQNSYLDKNLDYLPKTLIIHGKKDIVTDYKQAQMLHKKIPNSELIAFEQASHALHLHDSEGLRQLILDHAKK
jgi:pimeloyl-[acyl-carrier protein] methyl ester esterase